MERLFTVPWPSVILTAAAILAWRLSFGTRLPVRLHLRMATVLMASFGVAAMFDLAPGGVLPIASGLAAAFLSLAVYSSFRRPASRLSTIGMVTISGLGGVTAAVTGLPLFSTAPQCLCLLVVFSVARRGLMHMRAPSIQLTVGAVAWLAALSTQAVANRSALTGECLFLATGLLGLALAVARISDTFVKIRSPGAPTA